MSSIESHYHTSIFGTFFHDAGTLVAASFRSAKAYITLARAENELNGLDNRMLQDIGLSRSEITYAVRTGAKR